VFRPYSFTRVVVLTSGLVACSTAGGLRLRSGLDYGEERGKVWVRGPWEAITPAKDVDDVIDQLCPAVEKLERAKDGDGGVEYCGLLYALGDGLSYASVPSPLGLVEHQSYGPNKSCRIPLKLRETRGTSQILADYHSHPWAHNPFTKGDLRTKNQRWSIRIQFDSTCHIYKYVSHTGEDRSGEVFRRVGKSWQPWSVVRVADKPIGTTTPPLEEDPP
jgi:hypothetical protein